MRRASRRLNRNRIFADAVALRRYDDIGKQPDWQVPDLASYRPLLERLAVRPLA